MILASIKFIKNICFKNKFLKIKVKKILEKKKKKKRGGGELKKFPSCHLEHF